MPRAQEAQERLLSGLHNVSVIERRSGFSPSDTELDDVHAQEHHLQAKRSVN